MIAVAIVVSVIFVTINDVVIICDCTNQLYCFVDSNMGYIFILSTVQLGYQFKCQCAVHIYITVFLLLLHFGL